MGLFDKKNCDICGEKIGLLGNRKLEDGNLCKNCAKKLSPWFDERRHSTVQQIKDQLAYRQLNELEVEKFNMTRSFGEYYLVCLDDHQRKFLVSRTNDIFTENPDVLDCSQVTSCKLDVSENHFEVQQTDKDGNQVSCNPPQYRYEFNFYVDIHVNHPWFDDMRVPLNRSSVEIFVQTMRGNGMFSSAADTSARRSYEYQQYEKMGREIEDALMGGKWQQAVNTASVPVSSNIPNPASESGWTCECGAVNTGKFCTECGKSKPVAKQPKCSNCGWEPEDPENPPKFCPECGKPF